MENTQRQATIRPLKIETSEVRAVIYTAHLKVIGTIHIPFKARISDYLNKTLGGNGKDIFISLTDAECYSVDGGELKYAADFITVHKDHIQVIIPMTGEEIEEAEIESL